MDFALDDTQQAVAELTREILTRERDPDSAWKALGHAGLLAGDGLGVLETALVLYEIGRAAARLPALSTLALGVLPLGNHELLAPVGAGERLLTAALRGSVTVSGENLLSGTAIGVVHAASAYRILVPAGDTVFLVSPEDITLTQTYTASGAPEHTIGLDRTPGEPVCETTHLHRHATAGACAYGDGLLAGALDLTAAHVRTREQFGKPLATFQAVAQQIADVYIASRTLHLAAWSAIWRLAGERDPDEDLAVAAYWLAEEAMPALHTCHHLHGGVGVDASYPLHRYYSTMKDLVRMLGGVEHRLAAV
ncbi:acyl-CoA dehydrogenase family protein [Actinophytocola sp.]|uniref:acyl-CoA dehydrogenase family protein n=1 Tax=Actinophytocola sp. TaxID=1872138 RepID=UPI002D55F9F1|nr:acyl-CoA dehydrogenase family protein [Actinophytocola sp.]HYQ68856.1 acyl-CoA dehydrogenase family protein [Actinophytocola sp.]